MAVEGRGKEREVEGWREGGVERWREEDDPRPCDRTSLIPS